MTGAQTEDGASQAAAATLAATWEAAGSGGPAERGNHGGQTGGALKRGISPSGPSGDFDDTPAGAAVVQRGCPSKAARTSDIAEPSSPEQQSLQPEPPWFVALLLFPTLGPPDFGGRLVEMLWGGVRLTYSPPVEYLILLWFRPSEKERQRSSWARQLVAPELAALLRCSRALRCATLASIQVRRRILPATASPSEHERLEEICEEAKDRYPASWALAQQSYGLLQPARDAAAAVA